MCYAYYAWLALLTAALALGLIVLYIMHRAPAAPAPARLFTSVQLTTLLLLLLSVLLAAASIKTGGM